MKLKGFKKTTNAPTSTKKKKAANKGSDTGQNLPKEYVKTFEKVLLAMASIEKHEIAILDTKDKISALLRKIKPAATSFQYEGMYYSIRSRGERTFIVASEVPFGSWKRKKS